MRDFQPLLPGEQHLLQACMQGEVAKLGTAVPEAPSDAVRVRAAFLRFLLLGGDDQSPVHERGVRLIGAHVEGQLDLAGCRILHNMGFRHCLFTDLLFAQDARVEGLLTLEDSHLSQGINADRLQCDLGVQLRRGFKAIGGVRLLGARIGGNLDCTGGQFEVKEGEALLVDGADVKGDVFLSGGFKATGTVRLLGAQLGGDLTCSGGQFEVQEGEALSADRAIVKGSVFLSDRFKAAGEVRLTGAQIGGDLDCTRGQFEVEEGDALSADRAVVKGSVFLSGGFKATGNVRLPGAQIGGGLYCTGGQFEAQEGVALSANRAVVKGNVLLNGGFMAAGKVRLLGAQIGGVLNCTDGQFEVQKGDALSVDGAVVKGDVVLRGGFKATGEVRLLGAQIGGDLSCTGGQFEVNQGHAVSADGADVKGNVFLGDGFKAAGEVRLPGAQIGGDLDCTRGQFEAKEGDALSADRAVVKGSVFLSGGIKATGEVRLLGAQIGGVLDCTGGQFEVKEGNALSADGAVVKRDVLLSDGFKATGKVRLPGVQIGGDLVCVGGQFDVKNGATLSLGRAVVRGVWHLYELPQPVRVDASHADVAVLVDELDAWARGSVLDGLRYDALGGGAPTGGTDRVRWLCMQAEDHLGDADGAVDFRPQPWRQVQRVLREMGHTEDAKQLGIAFEDHLRAIGRLGQSPPGTPAPLAGLKRVSAWVAHYTFGKLAGYGYRPIRLIAWMVSVWFLCGAAYWWLALPPRSAMAPSDPLVFQNGAYTECLPDNPEKPGNWFLCAPLRGEYATFSPLAYSLDVLLPLVDLGQEKTWGAFVPTPKGNPLEELFRHRHWGHWARLLIWFETLFGWLSSLLLVAIVSGFSRRNDDE